MADSYSDRMLGGVQTQSIDRVLFDQSRDGGLLARIHARHGRIELRPDYETERLPKPKVLKYEVDFRLDGDTFKVTPETASVVKLFGATSRQTPAGAEARR